MLAAPAWPAWRRRDRRLLYRVERRSASRANAGSRRQHLLCMQRRAKLIAALLFVAMGGRRQLFLPSHRWPVDDVASRRADTARPCGNISVPTLETRWRDVLRVAISGGIIMYTGGCQNSAYHQAGVDVGGRHGFISRRRPVGNEQ